ncbi:MAG: hypothetical protein AB8B50_06595 [Pirellulaceae bacterium]
MSSDSRRWWIVGAVVLLLGGVIWWMSSGYGKVSDEGYQYAMALMSICNRKDESRLVQIVQSIREATESGELPVYDSKTLLRIAERAEDGDWEDAANLVRRLMKTQVEVAPV